MARYDLAGIFRKKFMQRHLFKIKSMTPQQIIANINPAALVWARQVRGMPLEIAAKKIGVTPERLESFESGQTAPTIKQLLKIGRVYRKPAAFFYLLELPEKPEGLHDYRRLIEAAATPSPELLDAVARARERRLDAIELNALLDRQMPIFKLSASRETRPAALAGEIRRVLRISLQEQKSWREPYNALRLWVAAAELAGLLVFQFSDVELEDARGFSIAERPLPVVAINGKDWPRAKIFTLIHEIAHIAISEPGICDLHVENEDDSIEIYCNEVAGEMLVPAEALLAEQIVRGHQSIVWNDLELQELSTRFSVSREVILRRLLSLGRTTVKFYQSKRRDFIVAAIETREREGGFLPYPRRVLRDNGRAFTYLVLSAYNNEAISALEVSRLLGGINLRHIAAISGEL
jgi:Zn-dependent peptidase ImmA (M78 family)/DNA-binding XRE family transcriptional regulator